MTLRHSLVGESERTPHSSPSTPHAFSWLFLRCLLCLFDHLGDGPHVQPLRVAGVNVSHALLPPVCRRDHIHRNVLTHPKLKIAYEDARTVLKKKPRQSLAKLYFDTIVHSVAALEYLVKVVGADRVVVGTDYPMAMGDFESVSKVRQLDLADADREKILGGNAARALNL